MSNLPPVVRPPSNYTTANPTLQSRNRAPVYIVGCFGMFFIGFLILVGVGIYIFQQSAENGRKTLEQQRADTGSTGSIPEEIREAISAAGYASAQTTEGTKPWSKADDKKLEKLLQLLENEDTDAIDFQRLVVEMTRVNRKAVRPFSEQQWARDLRDALATPEIDGNFKCIDARWIGEHDARVILTSTDAQLQTLMIVYLHEKYGEFRAYDWRETLEPMSEVEYWVDYAEIPEPNCYRHSNLIQKLDNIYWDDSQDPDTKAARLYAAYTRSGVPREYRAFAQNQTAVYLYFTENSDDEARRLSVEMKPDSFGGAHLWQARACIEDAPQRAYSLAMQAMEAVGWHPAATNIVLQTIDGESDELEAASEYIAQSIQFDTLSSPYWLLASDPAVVNNVVESLFSRCTSEIASDRLFSLLKDNYLAPDALEHFAESLKSVQSSDLLDAYLDLQRAELTADAEAEYMALERIIQCELNEETQKEMLQQFLSCAGRTGRISKGIAWLRASEQYDSHEVELALARAITSSPTESEWLSTVPLHLLQTNSPTVQTARATLLDAQDRSQEALSALLEIWPEREAEIKDTATYYDLDYSFAALSLVGRLAIELGQEAAVIDRMQDKSLATSLLTSTLFAKGDINELHRFISETDREIVFRPYYEAYCDLLLAPESSAKAVAKAIQWIDENADQEDGWPNLDAPAVTAPLGADYWELQDTLISISTQASVLPQVLDLLPEASRTRLATQHSSLVYSTEVREQLAQILDRLGDDAADLLKHKIEKKLYLLDNRLREAASAQVADLEAMDSHYRAAENTLINFLAETGQLDLSDEILGELDAEHHSDEHDAWLALAKQLRERDGSALRDNPLFSEITWANSLPMIEILSESGVLSAVSEQHKFSYRAFDTASTLVELTQLSAEEVNNLKQFASWKQVDEVDRFPEALAAWTRKTETGWWTAVAYQGIPPGLTDSDLPITLGRESTYVLIGNCQTPTPARRPSAVHRFVAASFGPSDIVRSVYTPELAVSWPAANWPKAMERFASDGKLDVRWINYSEGWTAYAIRYPRLDGKAGRMGLNFGGILEDIPIVEVLVDRSSPPADQSSRDAAVYKTTSRSICFPPLEAGIYAQ